jgi:hypothetical protein
MQRVQRVRHSGASVGHRSEHLADITWDVHVRATAGAECRKRIGGFWRSLQQQL